MSPYIKRRSNRGRFLWILLLLGVLGGAAFYFHYHPESLPEWLAKTGWGRELQTTTVYKWQDASGDWHVGDQPPPAGVEYKTEKYSRDTNILPLPPELQR